MQKPLTLIICLLGSCTGAALDSGEIEREARLFPLAQIVSFPNDVCTAGSYNGTCYTSEECTNRGGTNSGNSCASGFGVCCTTIMKCGSTSSENNTYIEQTSTPDEKNCVYTICPISDSITRIRYELNTHTIANPFLVTATAKATAPGKTGLGVAGQCITDRFQISNTNTASPIICGDNAGQHMILDSDGSKCHTVSFAIGQTTTTRKWTIVVIQYTASGASVGKGGPSGCLQYHTGKTGYVRSFAFPSTQTVSAASVTSTHLANQDYTICIRREAKQTKVCYTPIGAFTTDSTTAISTFALSVSASKTKAVASADSVCAKDYLEIPLGVDSTKTNSGKPTAANLLNKFCGRAFGTEKATKHLTICTFKTPFTMKFFSDGDEGSTATAKSLATKAELNLLPGGNLGFGLIYSQT